MNIRNDNLHQPDVFERLVSTCSEIGELSARFAAASRNLSTARAERSVFGMRNASSQLRTIIGQSAHMIAVTEKQIASSSKTEGGEPAGAASAENLASGAAAPNQESSLGHVAPARETTPATEASRPESVAGALIEERESLVTCNFCCGDGTLAVGKPFQCFAVEVTCGNCGGSRWTPGEPRQLTLDEIENWNAK